MSAFRNWTHARLGEKCSIAIGGTPSRSAASYWDEAKETSNLWVSIRDLNGRIITDTNEYISNAGVRHSNVKLQPEGTVLLSFKLTIGRVGIAGRPLYTNEAIAGLRSKEIRHDYLYYGLQQWDLLGGVDQAIKGATLNKEKLKKIEIEFPKDPLEQKTIAQILSTMDAAISQQEMLITKQERIHSGLMHDLLNFGVNADGNVRDGTSRAFKDSVWGQIPDDWTIDTLARCVRTGSPICYGILMPGAPYENGVPVVKVKDIVGGAIDQSDLLLTDPKIDQLYKRSRLRANDLLITIRGTTGRVATVPKELDGANITQDTARVRLKPEHSVEFFYFLLQSAQVQSQVALHTIGQAVKGINIGDVKKIAVALPEKDEQVLIGARLNESWRNLERTNASLKKLRAIKAALMQDLLTGRKRVTALLKSEDQREKVHA